MRSINSYEYVLARMRSNLELSVGFVRCAVVCPKSLEDRILSDLTHNMPQESFRVVDAGAPAIENSMLAVFELMDQSPREACFIKGVKLSEKFLMAMDSSRDMHGHHFGSALVLFLDPDEFREATHCYWDGAAFDSLMSYYHFALSPV